MTTAQMLKIKPGIVADRNGENYWFSGSALVPTRYDKYPIWGSGFTSDSQLFNEVAPFTQVSVLKDAPQRNTPTILHSPVNKNAKRRKVKEVAGTSLMKRITAKPLVTAILISIVLTVVLNIVVGGITRFL